MSYGPDLHHSFYLPVEQPTKFELAVNLQTAKQIGVMIPTDGLALADKVMK